MANQREQRSRKNVTYPRAIAWAVAGFLALVLVAYGLFHLLNPDARVGYFVVATCVILLVTARIYNLAKKREQERRNDHSQIPAISQQVASSQGNESTTNDQE